MMTKLNKISIFNINVRRASFQVKTINVFLTALMWGRLEGEGGRDGCTG